MKSDLEVGNHMTPSYLDKILERAEFDENELKDIAEKRYAISSIGNIHHDRTKRNCFVEGARHRDEKLLPLLQQALEVVRVQSACLDDVNRMLIDSTVVCKRCGDEETLQDSDMKYFISRATDQANQMLEKMGEP